MKRYGTVDVKDEKWFIKTLKRISNELALGSGRAEDLCWGMIRGWVVAKLISRRFGKFVVGLGYGKLGVDRAEIGELRCH